MKHRFILISILTIILPLFPKVSKAEEFASYKFDAGVHVGMSGYLGDANESSIFKYPGYTAGISFRYLPNTRWAIRGIFTTASLEGNTLDHEDKFPNGENYDFSSKIYDLGARFEFNFFSYGIGETYKKMRRWSPYISLGLGTTFASTEDGSNFALNIPMGVGLKYKLKQRVNLGLEFSMTKVISDNIDSKKLDDPYLIESSALKNTDWYSQICFSITYEFGKRCETCHYVD